jgi:hypothetical protein
MILDRDIRSENWKKQFLVLWFRTSGITSAPLDVTSRNGARPQPVQAFVAGRMQAILNLHVAEITGLV